MRNGFRNEVTMNKWKIFMWLSIFIANISWAGMFIAVSYNWGYQQCLTDRKADYFRAPLYLILLNGVPFLFVAAIFGGLAVYFYRKSK